MHSVFLVKMFCMNAKSLSDAGVCQSPTIPGYEHSWFVHPLPDRSHPETGFPGDTALHCGSPQTRAREPKTGDRDILYYEHCWLISLYSKPSPFTSFTLVIPLYITDYYFATQERLVLSILPRFVSLEMIADMSSLEDELSPHEFHKIYIHQYKDVRYTYTHMISVIFKVYLRGF